VSLVVTLGGLLLREERDHAVAAEESTRKERDRAFKAEEQVVKERDKAVEAVNRAKDLEQVLLRFEALLNGARKDAGNAEQGAAGTAEDELQRLILESRKARGQLKEALDRLEEERKRGLTLVSELDKQRERVAKAEGRAQAAEARQQLLDSELDKQRERVAKAEGRLQAAEAKVQESETVTRRQIVQVENMNTRIKKLDEEVATLKKKLRAKSRWWESVEADAN